jgi:hypothetical protein
MKIRVLQVVAAMVGSETDEGGLFVWVYSKRGTVGSLGHHGLGWCRWLQAAPQAPGDGSVMVLVDEIAHSMQ